MFYVNHLRKYFKLWCRSVPAVILSAVFLSAPSFALQGAEKSGVVDIGRILRLMPEMKTAEAALQAQAAPIKKHLELKNRELKQSIARFERQKQSMTPAVRAQKENELKQNIQALENYQKTNAGALEKRKQELFMGVRQKIVNVVQEIARREEFTVVLDKTASLYMKPDHDLTLKVMKQLNIQ